ncbi:hypothetical protein [Polynucleobacter sp. MWH-Adler-W8]|uniref:hypothetical protein n=1 Tax=Polynucleobacter sp. MWH-Adler-W8 TaxID=1819727 RepID=UPI000932217D|nr:hypothetical protein [Polynucleobacter sp. MWH-Adler-W8]
MRNRGGFGGFLDNKKIFVRRMGGIVAMLYKYFFTAKKKIHTLAHNDEGTLLDFENKNNEDGLSELKILVSVVRFRPGPPRLLGYVPDTCFTSGTDHMVYSCRSHPPIMNCPLKGRFIYWGFVIPVLVLRLFKRLSSRAGACDVVLNDKYFKCLPFLYSITNCNQLI